MNRLFDLSNKSDKTGINERADVLGMTPRLWLATGWRGMPLPKSPSHPGEDDKKGFGHTGLNFTREIWTPVTNLEASRYRW